VPADWPVPFSASQPFASSFACAALTGARGSMPEIVRHGENGFLVASLDDAAVAVGASSSLNRGGVRNSVERRFDAGRMVEDYLASITRL
jgi:hypothetical protein